MRKTFFDYIRTMMLAVFAMLVAFSVQACSKDDEGGSIPSGFCGTYCNNHQNRVYRYYTFYEDGTGEYRMEGNVSLHQGYFTFEFSGDKVICKGSSTGAWDDGSVSGSNINTTFTYSGGRLVTDGGDVYEKIY